MKRLIISLTVLLAFASCKGPGSGPLSKETFAKDGMSMPMEAQKSNGVVPTGKVMEPIEPGEGSLKKSDLLANKKSYSKKTIKVKGQVTKFNPR